LYGICKSCEAHSGKRSPRAHDHSA
jgi:hypothetical protein